MGSGSTFAADIGRARRLDALVTEGHAGSLAEAALRYAIGCDGLSMIVIGASSLEQLDAAAAAAAMGPLDAAVLDRIAALQRSFGGEPR
jgi:L-galactose dehydrogenase/L-glyceraldehyde 3-phosphate reductase